MADIEAIEVLTQAKERLFECGWTKGPLKTRTDAVPKCLEESLMPNGWEFGYVATLDKGRSQHQAHIRAAQYVRAAIGVWELPEYLVESCHAATLIGGFNLYTWNDEQKTAGTVFNTLDEAIRIAKEVEVIPV